MGLVSEVNKEMHQELGPKRNVYHVFQSFGCVLIFVLGAFVSLLESKSSRNFYIRAPSKKRV